MLRFWSFAVIVIILTFPTLSFGQETDEKLKQKQEQEIKLLEEILADADNLRLSENRALIYAEVGHRIWKADEKKARKLFDLAIIELIKAQNDATLSTSNKQNLQNLIYGQHPRLNILNLLSNYDAELALNTFLKTRPNKLSVTINIYRQKLENPNSPFSNQFRYSSTASFARSEIASEQSFISKAALQNPKRMAELFRKSLEKDVNYQTIQLLQKIHLKDPILASKLAEEVVYKLLNLEILKNGRNVNIYVYFLDSFGQTENTNNKRLKISAESIRNIADKLSTFWLSPKQKSFNVNSQSFKIIEKLFPSRASTLRQKQQKSMTQNQAQNAENERFKELLKTKPSGAELIKQLKNFSSYRPSIYESAINKFAEEGNVSQAVRIIKTEFPEIQANQRLTRIYTNLANNEVSKGNFQTAIAYINEISDDDSRFNPMLQLANSIYYKNQKENKEYALSILQQLDSFIDSNPKTHIELSKIISLANSYSQIEPTQSFRLLETVIQPLNEYSKALTITSQFGNNGRVRDGELIISMGIDATGRFNLTHVLQTLKKTDYSRTMQLINRFEQNEARIALKLKLVNSNVFAQIIDLPTNVRTPVIFGRTNM